MKNCEVLYMGCFIGINGDFCISTTCGKCQRGFVVRSDDPSEGSSENSNIRCPYCNAMDGFIADSGNLSHYNREYNERGVN